MTFQNISFEQKANAYQSFLEVYHKSPNYHEASNALCGRENCDNSIKSIMLQIQKSLGLKDTQSVKELIKECSENEYLVLNDCKMAILHDYYNECVVNHTREIGLLLSDEEALTQAEKHFNAWKNALIISLVVIPFLIAIALVITALLFPASLLTVGVCAGIVGVSLIATAAGMTDKYSQLWHQKEAFWSSQEQSIRKLAHLETTKLKKKYELNLAHSRT